MPNPLSSVTTWAYIIDGVGPAKIDAIGARPVDLVVVDSEDRFLDPFDAADIARMKGANGKQVISYLSIGEAETYRDYWQAAWEANPPVWLAAENPEWEGNIKVAYWDPAWQDIVFNMVDGIVDAGFDGLYLDIIDAYYYWEDTAPMADPDHYRDEMVSFVGAIRARAEARMADTATTRDFAIIGQNGEDLAEDPAYLAVIDGIGKEDLYFYYPNGAPGSFREVPRGWLTGSKELLEIAEAAGVEVLAVEYVPPRFRDQVIGAIRTEMRYLKELSAPLYLSTNRALTEIEISVGTDGRVRFWGDDERDSFTGTPWSDLMDGAGGGDVLKGGGGWDRLSGGDGRDRLFGGDGRDVLEGGAASDHLFGGRMGDRIEGGAGWDIVEGGRGADVFVFRPGDGGQRIVDFGRGGDRLDLRDFALDGWRDFKDAGSRVGKRLVFDLDGDTLVLDHTRWSEIDPGDVLF